MRLRAVTQDVLDAYRLWCERGGNGEGTPIQPAAVASCIGVTIRLAKCGAFLSHDRLQVVAWRGRTAYVVAGVVEPMENATRRIPEAVLSGLLRWSLFYVEVAAADILAATADTAGMDERRRLPGLPLEKLAAMAGRAACGRPGHSGRHRQRWHGGRHREVGDEPSAGGPDGGAGL